MVCRTARAPSGGDAMRAPEDTAEPTVDRATDAADAPLGAQARVYAEARRRADEKRALVAKLGGYLVMVLIVRIFAGPFVAGIVAFFGGLGLGKQFGAGFVAPRVGGGWVEEEGRERVSRGVHRERETLAAEHTRSLEELSAQVAHDIRNPIAAARSLVQQMGEDPNSPENVEYARVALEELGRVERSISHLLRFARDEALRPSAMRVVDTLDASLETLRERIALLGVQVERRFDGSGEMIGDSEQLRRVFGNLIGNALDAMG